MNYEYMAIFFMKKNKFIEILIKMFIIEIIVKVILIIKNKG